MQVLKHPTAASGDLHALPTNLFSCVSPTAVLLLAAHFFCEHIPTPSKLKLNSPWGLRLTSAPQFLNPTAPMARDCVLALRTERRRHTSTGRKAHQLHVVAHKAEGIASAIRDHGLGRDPYLVIAQQICSHQPRLFLSAGRNMHDYHRRRHEPFAVHSCILHSIQGTDGGISKSGIRFTIS